MYSNRNNSIKVSEDDEYLETYYQFCSIIVLSTEFFDDSEEDLISNAISKWGTSGLYMLAKEWTDEFIIEMEKEFYPSEEVSEGLISWHETICAFVQKKQAEFYNKK